jgi:hypothetical protein
MVAMKVRLGVLAVTLVLLALAAIGAAGPIWPQAASHL